ncbi:MAG: hypothetical protein EXS51_04215 [Candidatus Taylorbacteria bacterium]|nr:hypothetical protein [Candidatus Taylorbacteria bacterium]
MTEGEKFPEPLTAKKTASRLRNDQFPNPVNLEGKGYQKFQPPKENAKIESSLILLKNITDEALNFLKEYKGAKSSEQRSELRVFFSALRSIGEVFKRTLKHPADMERIFSDSTFVGSFSFLVKGIKSKIMPDLESVNAKILLKEGKDFLIPAEIYLASRTGENVKEHE